MRSLNVSEPWKSLGRCHLQQQVLSSHCLDNGLEHRARPIFSIALLLLSIAYASDCCMLFNDSMSQRDDGLSVLLSYPPFSYSSGNSQQRRHRLQPFSMSSQQRHDSQVAPIGIICHLSSDSQAIVERNRSSQSHMLLLSNRPTATHAGAL